MLPSSEERIDQERLNFEKAMRPKTAAEGQARKLADKLRELGIDPEKL